MTKYTTPLDTTNDALEVVGGKGRSLAKLANAGFNVPGGFQVTTAAYRRFVESNDLQDKIVVLAKPVLKQRGVSFEEASQSIRALFAEHELNADIAEEIGAAYGALEGAPAVAVRSSATAEDLPGLSFAGQQ